jgi:hypothetical protein
MHLSESGRATKICHGWLAAAHTGRHIKPGSVPWSFSPSDALVESLSAQGYSDIVQTLQGQLCGLFRFNFPTGLVVALNADSYARRYCFEQSSPKPAPRCSYGTVRATPTGRRSSAKAPSMAAR